MRCCREILQSKSFVQCGEQKKTLHCTLQFRKAQNATVNRLKRVKKITNGQVPLTQFSDCHRVSAVQKTSIRCQRLPVVEKHSHMCVCVCVCRPPWAQETTSAQKEFVWMQWDLVGLRRMQHTNTPCNKKMKPYLKNLGLFFVFLFFVSFFFFVSLRMTSSLTQTGKTAKLFANVEYSPSYPRFFVFLFFFLNKVGCWTWCSSMAGVAVVAVVASCPSPGRCC